MDMPFACEPRLGQAVEPSDLLAQVREQVNSHLASDASLERVALELRLSSRTLRRRLTALGATFHGVLEDIRRERAVAFLAESNATIDHVALQLGYRDTSNFRRAFRRWTGLAPTVFRAQNRC